MASIHRRPDKPKPYQVKYRDPEGKQHSKSFRRKIDAESLKLSLDGRQDRAGYFLNANEIEQLAIEIGVSAELLARCLAPYRDRSLDN